MDAIEIRHKLHQHPGLSGDEAYAHDLIVRTLAECAPTEVCEHVGGYGVIAVWGANKSKPTLVFRGDTDALPIAEHLNLAYRSETEGVGHKCGHDGHTAILLQLASMLGADAEVWKDVNVILVFQPEEETGYGSQKILDSGVLQQYNVKAVYGLHNLPGFPKGCIVLNYHTFAAASVGEAYRLTGRQTHASTPEKGINPGLAIAEIVQRFAQLNSGTNVSDDEFTQSTLICIHCGDVAFGTSAGQGEVMFTLRAYTNERMEKLMGEANAIVGEVAARHHLVVEQSVHDGFMATENNSQLVERLEQLFVNNGHQVRNAMEPFRWSEDFANYLVNYPGAFFGVGIGENHCELHHPDYDFEDGIIVPAAQCFYEIIKEKIYLL